MQNIDLRKKTGQWLVLLMLAFIWGSSFILMKKSMLAFSHTQVALFRIFFSFCFFIPIILKRLKKLKKERIIPLLIVGFIGNLGPALLFTKGQTQVSSSMAGILNSLTPIFSLLIAVFFFRSKYRYLNIAGIILGFAGAVGLVLNQNTSLSSGNNLYGLFIVLAALFYGININVIKNKLPKLDGVSITALAFMFIGPVAGLWLLFTDFTPAMQSPDLYTSLLYVGILAFMGSFIAGMGFNILVSYTSAIFAASVTYIIPVFAVFWGIMDGESIKIGQIVWILLILAGVYLVNYQKKKV